jgi:hypothetical protein
MKIEQRQYISEKWSSEEINTSAQLVLVFVSSDLLQDLTIHTSLQNFYPHSNIVYTSAY